MGSDNAITVVWHSPVDGRGGVVGAVVVMVGAETKAE